MRVIIFKIILFINYHIFRHDYILECKRGFVLLNGHYAEFMEYHAQNLNFLEFSITAITSVNLHFNAMSSP